MYACCYHETTVAYASIRHMHIASHAHINMQHTPIIHLMISTSVTHAVCSSHKSDDSDSSYKENNCTDPNASSSSQNGCYEFVLSDKVLNDTWLMGLI